MKKITLIALGVSDIAKSVEFYSRKAGFELQNQFGSLAFFTAGPVTLMLNGGLRRPEAPLAGAMEIVVAAESVAAAHRELIERVFFLMIRRPPRSTLFPYTTFSDP